MCFTPTRAAVVALFVSGLVAAFQQHKHSPIIRTADRPPIIDWTRVGIVVAILAAAILANVVINIRYPALSDLFPFIGVAVWIVIILTAPIRRPDWELLGEASRGAVFLLSLVLAASLMPVDQLPSPSWQTTFGLGFVSSVFDNIPLTKLALEQGGYDWGVLAFAVGYGGSMIWFGSSAGVAITNLFPEARSVGAWLKSGWHVAVAYVIGFFVMLMLWAGSRMIPTSPRHHSPWRQVSRERSALKRRPIESVVAQASRGISLAYCQLIAQPRTMPIKAPIADTSAPNQRETGTASSIPKATPPMVPIPMMRPRRLLSPTMVWNVAATMIRTTSKANRLTSLTPSSLSTMCSPASPVIIRQR